MASAPNARPCDRRPRLRFAFPLPCTRIDAGAMLENINLKKKLSREDYRLALPGLQQRLYDLEKACWRSEEHTSELQSLRHLVCRLLLEKKKKNNYIQQSAA